MDQYFGIWELVLNFDLEYQQMEDNLFVPFAEHHVQSLKGHFSVLLSFLNICS